MNYECRLVALAALGHGGQIGRVGLNQDAVERHFPGCLANVSGFWKTDISGEGDKEPHVQSAAGVLPTSGEAMQNPTEASGGPMVVAQNFHGFVPSVFTALAWPAMNHNRQTSAPSLIDLLVQNLS